MKNARSKSAPQETQAKSPKPRSRSTAAIPAVAKIVKALRQQAGLTLNELAQRSEVASSTISKIEAGHLSPGYEIIVRLAQGLQVDVAELFKSSVSTAASGRRGVTRRGAGAHYMTKDYAYEALAADVARKEFLPLKAVIKARTRLDWGDLPAHVGEEFVYVLKGSVTLFSEHYEPLELAEGDCVYFDSRSGHAFASTSDEDAEVLWVCSHHDAMAMVHS